MYTLFPLLPTQPPLTPLPAWTINGTITDNSTIIEPLTEMVLGLFGVIELQGTVGIHAR